jgi:hypothetical protein
MFFSADAGLVAGMVNSVGATIIGVWAGRDAGVLRKGGGGEEGIMRERERGIE